MPELPEVETVRRGLEPCLAGATIRAVETRRADLRFPLPAEFARRLSGATILSLARRAKYLVAELSTAEVLIMHLGMTGRFLVVPPAGPVREPGAFYSGQGRDSAHDHVTLHLSNGSTVIYNDVRRFGFMDLVPRAGLAACRHFARMGVEPLGNELGGALVAELFAGKAAPLKAALLDQGLIAGLGNIYVCEVLHRAGLSPRRRAGTLAREDGSPRPGATRLAAAIRAVLEEAVAAGGSTLRDFSHADGAPGSYQHHFRVYDREGEACVTPGCSGMVKRTVQSGRSTYSCSACQR